MAVLKHIHKFNDLPLEYRLALVTGSNKYDTADL